MELPLEYSYNLNVVKEVTITNSFLTLKDSVRKCQNTETYSDCITNKFLQTLKDKCNCLPLKLAISTEDREVTLCNKSEKS